MNITTAPDTDKKLFVLDTNVLMHDPTCIFRFQEHDIFIPMIVLEESDNHKKGPTEVARNVRQTNRFLDDLIKGADLFTLQNGIPLSGLKYSGTIAENCAGRLFFQTKTLELGSVVLPEEMAAGKNDNTILKIVVALKKQLPDTKVVLVTKDINMRIKAATMELQAEDYSNDQVVEDVDLLYSGISKLPSNFWDTHGKNVTRWHDQGRHFCEVKGRLVKKWHPNQFLYFSDEPDSEEFIVRKINKTTAILEVARNFRSPHNNVWGITAKNREQNFALNALLDMEIDFVTLLGPAGTGKTLLALAAALMQIFDKKSYIETIFTRETVSIGEEIGFLPGTEEEKMKPWMGALTDNLELLGNHNKNGAKEIDPDAGNAILWKRIKIRSLNFMRGRTFLKRFLIIDEAQNLTAKQMKTLITRAGPETKIVCIGNLGQIDTPYLSATTSGLTNAVESFKDWEHSAHIIMPKCERGRLADYANDNL
jgi:PhoH-like ATPase